MAIDLKNKDHRQKLAGAIKRSFELGSGERERRADLIRIYADRPKMADLVLGDRNCTAYLNLFSQFVRGHQINLAYRSPKWSVNARTVEGKGFDKKLQAFLDQYACILNFSSLVERWADDSAFGRAVGKVINSVAPKGISSPSAPRCYRLNPDHFIPDRSAPCIEEATYLCDMFFVDLDTIHKHEFYNEERRKRVGAWGEGNAGTSAFPYPGGDTTLFATDQGRLIDVYIPTLGIIATWPCSNDSFGEIANEEPLQTIPSKVNPYPVLDLCSTPDDLESISRLGQLRPLNMLANHLYEKAANQSKQSQRNPVYKLGDELDANSVLSRPDGEPAGMNDPKTLDLYVLPGADGGLVQMAEGAASKFSENAGNLNVALGTSPGANTARQTQAMIGQITQAQAVDRMKFERFLAEVGKRLGTLAFFDKSLQLTQAVRVPGTKYYRNEGWGPSQYLPRVGQIDDYLFETVPYSTAFRGPSERLQQLVQASQIVGGAFQQAARGIPINPEAVLEDAAESFDLIPNLRDWYTGQPQQTPQQKTGQVYQSMAGPAQGSDVNYNSNAGGGGANDYSAYASQAQGLASGP